MKILVENPTDFDRACAAAGSGDTIQLLANVTYLTRGSWAFPASAGWCHLASGVTLAGAPGAKLAFATDAICNGRPANDINLLWGVGNNTINGPLVFDATPPRPGLNTNGLRFFGRYSISGIDIRGLRGSWSGPTCEVFALSSTGATAGSVVRNVTVSEVAANSYVSGIYIGGITGTPDEDQLSVVTDSSVNLGADNQFAFSCSGRTNFARCSATGGKYGLYTDTGPMVALMTACDLVGSYAGISSVQAVSAAKPELRMVSFTGGTIRAPRVVEWWDKQAQPAMSGCVVLTDSQISGPFLFATAGPANENVSLIVADCMCTNECKNLGPYAAGVRRF